MIKRKFSALIPAFDPRPGRTNVNQTTDLELSPPETSITANQSADAVDAPRSEEPLQPHSIATTAAPAHLSSGGKGIGSVVSSSKTSPDRDMKSSASTTTTTMTPRLSLVLRGPNLPGIDDVEVELTSLSDSTIFKAVQTIIQQSSIGSKAEKIRRIWEPTYVIAYGEASDKESSPLSLHAGGENSTCDSAPNSVSPACVLPQMPLLSQVKYLIGLESVSSTYTNITHFEMEFIFQSHCSMDEVLQLLRQLYILCTKESDQMDHTMSSGDHPEGHQSPDLLPEMFMSKKITNKLVQQIQDPLVLSGTLRYKMTPFFCFKRSETSDSFSNAMTAVLFLHKNNLKNFANFLTLCFRFIFKVRTTFRWCTVFHFL